MHAHYTCVYTRQGNQIKSFLKFNCANGNLSGFSYKLLSFSFTLTLIALSVNPFLFLYIYISIYVMHILIFSYSYLNQYDSCFPSPLIFISVTL